ncbi:MAG: sigma-70 family RNA polymerase sigma factor [Gemmatimonadota bacterium]
MDFQATFESQHASLFRYVNRLVGDDDLAADVVQESFVRLLENPMPEEEARRWLFTVATNLVRDDARSRTRHQRLLAESDVRPEPVQSPHEAATRAERVRAVRRALAALAERDRTMLLMREEGFRYAEIAELVGVAPGSVGTLLSRALERFERALDPAWTPDAEGETEARETDGVAAERPARPGDGKI